MMAEILGKMKKHHAEKFIITELRHHLTRMLQIAEHLNDRMLEIVAKHVAIPSGEKLPASPYTSLFRRIQDF